MISIFIVILGVTGEFSTVVQCMAWRWCEVFSLSSFNHLVTAGVVECFFEIVGIIKIYRKRLGQIL